MRSATVWGIYAALVVIVVVFTVWSSTTGGSWAMAPMMVLFLAYMAGVANRTIKDMERAEK